MKTKERKINNILKNIKQIDLEIGKLKSAYQERSELIDELVELGFKKNKKAWLEDLFAESSVKFKTIGFNRYEVRYF